MNSRWKKHTFFLIPKKILVANKKCVNKKLSLFISAKQKKTQTQRLTIQNPFKLAKTGMVVPNSNLKQNNFEYVQTLPTTKKYLKKNLYYKKTKIVVVSQNSENKSRLNEQKIDNLFTKKSSWTKNNHNYNDDDDGDDDGHWQKRPKTCWWGRKSQTIFGIWIVTERPKDIFFERFFTKTTFDKWSEKNVRQSRF